MLMNDIRALRSWYWNILTSVMHSRLGPHANLCISDQELIRLPSRPLCYIFFLVHTFTHMCMYTHVLAQIENHCRFWNPRFLSFTLIVNELLPCVWRTKNKSRSKDDLLKGKGYLRKHKNFMYRYWQKDEYQNCKDKTGRPFQDH